MNKTIYVAILFLAFTFSCSTKENRDNKTKSDTDSIDQVPEENVRPTGDLRSVPSVELDSSKKQ